MSSLAEETFALVTQELALPELREEFDEQKAVGLLTKAVKQLLDQNLERFLQICYRVDLAENTLKKSLLNLPQSSLPLIWRKPCGIGRNKKSSSEDATLERKAPSRPGGTFFLPRDCVCFVQISFLWQIPSGS